MRETQDPTWTKFGAELRRLRERAGRTQTDLGKSALLSKSMISALERGTKTPKEHQVEALDTALSTGGALMRLRGDLTDERSVPAWFRDTVALERRAQEIREYHPMLIPGLLQIQDYAKTMIAARYTGRTSAQTEELAKARADRLTAILKEAPSPPLLWFVIRQAALEEQIGGKKVMKDQLAHLTELAKEGTVRVQVLPSGSLNAGLCEAFRVTTVDRTQSVAYVDHAVGGETIDTPETVCELQTLFSLLAGEALPVSASTALINNVKAQRYD